jgi:hypothetical protein
VQLPRWQPAGLAVLDFYHYPGALPWAPLYLATKKNWPVIVPADFTCGSESGPSPELQTPDPLRRARIVLTRSDAKEVTLVLTGKYLLPEDPRKAHLELPRPVGNLDRGGKVTIVVDDQLELLFGDPEAEETVRGQHQRTFLLDTAPRQAEFAWRSYRPDFPVTAVTDITVHGINAHVHHELRCKFPERETGQGKSGARQVLLRVPSAARALRIIPEARLDPRKGLALVSIPQELQAKPIVVEYDVTLPAGQGRIPPEPNEPLTDAFALPLVWPEQATRIDAKVRVWCDPGVVPLLDDAPDPIWRDRGSEATEGRISLPSLVLHASGVDLPLRLRLLPAKSNLPPVVFDKGLVQVEINEEGAQRYRVRFLVSKLNSDHLIVEFPAPVTGVIPIISLNKQRIDNWRETDSRSVRVPVRPSLYDQPVILELQYQLPASVTQGDRISQTLLFPPDLPGAVFLGRIRWQLVLSSGEVVLVEGPHVQPEHRWEFRNGLLTPEPGAGTEDLERWLTVESTGQPQAASVVFWRTLLEPLRIWHFPRLVWFTLCSAVVLVIGLGLSFASLSRFTFWFLIALVAVTAMVAGLLWPSLFPPVAYGAQPGLVVLFVILALQWMLQERYRRQVVFMPGFTRLKSNSSLIVNTAGRPRDASTVDAPGAPSGSGKKQPAQ